MYLYANSNTSRLTVDSAYAYQSGICFQSAGTDSAVLYRPASSADQRMYLSSGGDVMTWTNTNPGRVGINNSSPSYTLDVSGNCRVSALTTAGGGYSLIAGGASASNYTAVGASADTSGQIIMFMNGSARSSDGGTLTGTIRNDAGGDLRFITNSSGMYVKASTGCIGINNSSPVYTLDIAGSAHASTLLCDSTLTIGSLLSLPSVAMTSNSTAGFTCTASGTNGGRQVYYLFDRTTTTGWAGAGPYNGSSPYGQLYSGTVTTTVSGVSVAGEWVQLQCPSAYNIVSYTVTDTNQRASAWTIAGSNDASTWTFLDSRALTSVPTAATVYTTTSSNIAFAYLRYIVTVVTGYQVPDQAELSFNAGLGRIGVNNVSPSFQVDVTGSARVTNSLTMSNGNGVLNGRNFQSGQVRASQNNYVTVTFPYAFSNAPIVVATCAESYAAPSTTYSFCPFCTNITTTSFQFIANYFQTGSSTINTSGNLFNWIAVSPTG